MLIHCGTDIVKIDRIKKALLNKTGEGFKARIFSEEEISYCESKGKGSFQSYAVRFAGKEAFAKAMGTGFGQQVNPHEVVILNNGDGKPTVQLQGDTFRHFKEKGYSCVEISLSHEDSYAIAFVIIL